MKDWYAEKNRGDKRYSLRQWADKAGFKARDYLLRVMQGQRNLSRDGMAKLAASLRLTERQSRYFESLVVFNQATDPIAKEAAWRRLNAAQKGDSAQKLRLDQYEYYSSWHHAAMRSLLPVLGPAAKPNSGSGSEPTSSEVVDWEALARRFDPPLTAKQARDSVEMLLRLGLLRQDKGRYSAASGILTTGDEVASMAVAQFHKTVMDLVKRSIDKHPSPSRDISGVTMSLSQQGYKRIKSEISAFRKKVMAIAAEDCEEDMVYQLNLHFIPLTRNRGSA